jgi:hypothetical protein
MKKLVVIGLAGLRLAVVTLVTFALLVSGAGAVHRLFAEQYQAQTPEARAEAATLDGRPDAEETPGGMAPGSRPCTEQAAWLQAYPALLPGSVENKSLVNSGIVASSEPEQSRPQDHQLLFSTPCLVASQIGHRLTLVGARPSGTS